MTLSFKDSIIKYKLKKASPNIKIYQVVSSLSFNDVGIHLRDGPFESDVVIVNLRPSKRTHWVASINECFFDSYGCLCPNKKSRFLI